MVSQRHSVRACIQTLEPRRLLSAAIPTLTGAPFTGTVGNGAGGVTTYLTIVVAKERKTGKISGTFTESSNGNVSVRSFNGAVNSHDKIVLHIKRKVVSVHPHFVINPEAVTGNVSADGNTMSGTTNSGGFRGTFAAARTP